MQSIHRSNKHLDPYPGTTTVKLIPNADEVSDVAWEKMNGSFVITGLNVPTDVWNITVKIKNR